MDSFERYEISVEKELLLELGAEAIATCFRYFREKNIDYKNEKEPLVILYNKISEIKHNLLTEKFDTMEKLNQARGMFKLVIEYIESLEGI